MGVAFAIHHGVANSFAPSQWKPSFGANWSFLPIIIYNFMGFELMSSAAGAVKNPRRDIPRMLLMAGADHRGRPADRQLRHPGGRAAQETSPSSPAWPTP